MLERPEAARTQPEVLPLHEIDFCEMPADRPRIVSFEGKWVEDSAEFRGTRPVPCELPPELQERVASTALQAFRALELRDYGRVDLRLDADGQPYVIDVNPNCDLSGDGGGFARAARAAGLSLRGPGPAPAGAGPEQATRCGHDPPCQAIARR